MASYLQPIVNHYNHLMIELRDPRVDGWLFMSSPLPTIIICAIYVYTVEILGPHFMKNRPPFELKSMLVVYNFLQVLFSTYLFSKIFTRRHTYPTVSRAEAEEISNPPNVTTESVRTHEDELKT